MNAASKEEIAAAIADKGYHLEIEPPDAAGKAVRESPKVTVTLPKRMVTDIPDLAIQQERASRGVCTFCGEAFDPRVPGYCKACRAFPETAEPMYWNEKQKYEAMWSHEQYRQVSPGEQIAPEFLAVAKPRNGSRVIDFGCGTGRGSLATAIFANLGGIDLHIEMLDFAANALDPEVIKAAEGEGTTRLHFTQHDLTNPSPVQAEYALCTDVMEHIPPEQVDLVLKNILQAARHVFFQISCTDDACGVLIGHPLHLSVHEPAWWKKKFEDIGCTIHYWRADDEDYCIAYVTAWADGQDVVDVGTLNIEEQKIRENVRTNLKAGWNQMKPHLTQPTEVMIIGGGPSLAGQLDTIRRLRFEGVKLVTLNGAYNWAIENGFEVSAQIVVDARPHNARFTKPVQSQTIYLIGSQCDPSVLEGLPKERTLLWHTTAEAIKDILEEECPGQWFGVPGGSTVLLRAIPLLRMLGYCRFHLFGCDSCVVSDTRDPNFTHHAYLQPENDGAPIIPATIGGRVFQCNAWHISQAQEFMTLIAKIGDMFELQVHGDGLLAWILQHGAQVDIELEAAAQKASKISSEEPT